MSKRKRKGKFCVVAGWISTHYDNLSLHELNSKRGQIRNSQTVDYFCENQAKRLHYPDNACVKHFTADCYPKEYSLKLFGITGKRKSLFKDAVPSIHFSGTVNCSILGKRTSLSHGGNFKGETWGPSQPKKIRPAFLKRECFRVRDS